MPLVTIVTSCFNQARFLEATLESVRRQDYPHIEHIVIDGGSTDGSVDIIRRYQPHIAHWVSEPDRGQSHAINKGFSRAHGTIFAWLNSDDLLAPSAVRLAVAMLETDPELGLVYGDRVHIDAHGNAIGFRRGASFSPLMLKRNITLPQETAFFRRRLFEEVGGLDENLQFSMDFDLWCKMVQVARFRHLPAFLGAFREHENAKSVRFHQRGEAGSRQFQMEHESVYRRHFGRPLPGHFRARCYRNLARLRSALERQTPKGRRERERIRRILDAAPQEGRTL